MKERYKNSVTRSFYGTLFGILLSWNSVYGVEIPSFPEWADPITSFEYNDSGVIHFESQSPVDFRGIFTPTEDETKTVLEGRLILPENASKSKRVPAMIILHGSGGIRPEREKSYGEFLAENGIAAFVINSYSGRGVSSETSYETRVLCVTEADMVADAYAALQLLQSHPKIDPTRIGLMGFSMGGIAARFALDERVRRTLSPSQSPFALHVEFYAPCFMDLGTSETTGAPFYSFRGALDESMDLLACTRIEETIRKGGSRAGTHIYSDAAHAWEFLSDREFRRTLNPVGCRIRITPDGGMELNGENLNLPYGIGRTEKIRFRAGVLRQMADCLSEGYTMGNSPKADRHARRELLELVQRELKAGLEWQEANSVVASRGMVVAPEELAAEAGLSVLRQGGNAVDAAVTVGFTLAVTFPAAGNLGGGGFMLVHLSEDGINEAVDYREKAPKKATHDMFLDSDGEVNPDLSRFSPLSVGVPGTVKGLALALERFGTISLETALQPAIKLAEEGFPVSEGLHRSLANEWRKSRLLEDPAAAAVFYDENGEPPGVGELLIQKDLGRTLRLIAEHGVDAFYRGEVADKFADFMRDQGGLITRDDLGAYDAVIRSPIEGDYRGYTIFSMPPPSSGGIYIVQILNMLEPYPLGELRHDRVAYVHLVAEAMKRAYADRATFLGGFRLLSRADRRTAIQALRSRADGELFGNCSKP